MPPALLLAGTAVAGGVAGAMGSNSKSTNQDSYGVNLSDPSQFQSLLSGNSSGSLMDSYNQLQGMVNAGPGQQSVTDSMAATGDYSNMLQQYEQNGGAPSQADITQGNQLAQNVFAPQQTQLQQSFLNQGIQANRQAAMMGRSTNDPVLQAKLATSQTQQQALLNSQQGSYAANFAQGQPMQKLGFAQQRAGVLGGLATQAMSNRQALASLGSGLLNQQQNYQLASSTHWSNGTQQGQSGGGVGGAITGGLGGLGAGMSAISGMGKMFGSGTTSSPNMGNYWNSNPYSSSGTSFGGSSGPSLGNYSFGR